MKKILIIVVSIIVLAYAAFLGYKYLNKPKTPIQDLNKELMQTQDDGGQADFKALDQDAAGL